MAESNYLPEAMLQVAGFLASFAVIALLFTMMFTPAVRGHATVPPSIERRKFLATLGGAAALQLERLDGALDGELMICRGC